jgi:hypothetical protein
MSNETELHKAYVRLKALRDNLPDALVLEQHWVTDFHTLVEMLANLAGADLRGFVVPDRGRLSSTLHTGSPCAFIGGQRLTPRMARYPARAVGSVPAVAQTVADLISQ